MKPRILILALSLFVLSSAHSQRIIEPGGFWYETEFTTENIGDADPDSVYVFSHWGSGAETEEDDPDVPVEKLLKCRNIQKLVLRSCSVPTIIANLDRFPLLQELELWDNGLGSFPEKISSLKNLRILTVSDLSFVKFEPASWEGNKIEELYFTRLNSDCEPEGEVCVLNFSVFQNLTYLSLENSNVSSLAPLQHCQKLTKLDINSCENLRTIGFDLGTLTELNDIRLYNLPNMTEAPQGFGGLANLTSLSITGCGFEVSSALFEGSSSLESFSLSENPVQDLDFLNQMPNLTMLTLEYLTPEQCPASLSGCENISTLNLYQIHFTSFPAFVLELKNLFKLTINNHEITKLPAGLSALNQLYDLDLSFGELTTIEPGALNLPKLNYLNINYNKVSALSSLGGMPELMSLNLTGNQLTQIPSDISNLAELRYVDLESNLLASLPAGLGGLKSLYNIDADENKLTALPADLFNAPSLTLLSFKRNNLKTLPKTVVKSPELKTLYLSGNKGIKLPKKVKGPKLENLFLSAEDLPEKEMNKLKAKLGDVLQISEY